MDTPKTAAEQLFGEALELPREQRSAFLDGACCNAPELRRRVELLLSENDRITGFLAEPILDGAPNAARSETVSSQYPMPPSETRLGRYSIEGKLGSGGMGVVYRARDEKLERMVALKVLAPGLLGGEEARRRFRREALALAQLNHPHIAAVYDTGEQEGCDYIVME